MAWCLVKHRDNFTLPLPCPFETFVSCHITTRRHNTEDQDPNLHRLENLKSRILIIISWGYWFIFSCIINKMRLLTMSKSFSWYVNVGCVSELNFLRSSVISSHKKLDLWKNDLFWIHCVSSSSSSSCHSTVLSDDLLYYRKSCSTYSIIYYCNLLIVGNEKLRGSDVLQWHDVRTIFCRNRSIETLEGGTRPNSIYLPLRKESKLTVSYKQLNIFPCVPNQGDLNLFLN